MAVMMRTMLEVADNSGARKLQMILPLGGSTGLRAGLGDVVTASVKEASPESAIKKGKVVRCVIVRMRKEARRKDGTYIRFDDNAAVLIDDAGFGQWGTFGGQVPTPNLDRLARSGLRYTRFHTTALCSPSRAALLDCCR